MTRYLRDTEDGINEAGWEAEMQRGIVTQCERCRRAVAQIVERHIDNGENGSEWLCISCFEKVTETGSCDPENRDWDAERELP